MPPNKDERKDQRFFEAEAEKSFTALGDKQFNEMLMHHVYDALDSKERQVVKLAVERYQQRKREPLNQAARQNSNLLSSFFDDLLNPEQVEAALDKAKSAADTTKKGLKGFLNRAFFHAKAFGVAIVTGVLGWVLPSGAIDVPVGTTLAMTFFGLLLMFPHKPNRFASVLGVLVALLTVVAGYWPFAFAFGGLIAAIVNIVQRRSVTFGFFIALPLMLFSVIGALGGNVKLFEALPTWLAIVMAGVTAIGVLSPPKVAAWVEGKFAKVLKLSSSTVDNAKAQAPQQEASVSQNEQRYQIHMDRLKAMAPYAELLPQDMLSSFKNIAIKTQGIIKCMLNDERDVIPGSHFLNRYLPMIQTIIERYILLEEHQIASTEIEKTKVLTAQALADMSYAFTQMHQRLVDNDVDDLMVSLKVMDRLRQSEGYDPFKR